MSSPGTERISPVNDRGPEGAGAYASATGALLDYLRVVYRRRWLAASVFLAVVLSVAAYTFTRVPMYDARASILIEVEAPNVIDFKEVLQEGSRFDAYYQTQYELLKSPALARKTVGALELWKRPDFGAPTESAAVGALLRGLLILPVRGSRLVNVRFRSPNPKLSAEIANAHARQYIEQSLENRFLVSKEATEWLDRQLAEERKRVEQSESALQAYREEHDALSLKDGQDIVVHKLSDLNAAVTRAKTNRIQQEAQYRELQAVQNDRSAVDSIPAILSNSFIQELKGDLARAQREYAQLSETLGERHPTLIEKRSAVETTEKRLAAEVAQVVESVRNAYQAALAEETSLMRALEEQKREALALNRRGIEYAALEREAESVRLVYQSLLQRAKETGVSRELRATNIRIVDLAEPPGGPATPRTQFNLLMSLFTGTLLALGAAFFVELLDDRVKTPDDLRGHFGLPFLGLVPEVRSKDRSKASLLQRDAPPSFVEAVRALRTSVVSSSGVKDPRSIVVASAASGEGKTLVASSLAIALAQAHHRVLLIDADMRRPSVHGIFGRGLEPGLSNVLAGTATLGDALRATTVPGLTVLSAGAATLKAPELLGSALFKELFHIVQEHFAWVIVDSPPVLDVTDASVVARRASGVVFVVGAGMTSSRRARLAIEELQHAGGHVLGTVLNRAKLEHHSFYYSPYARGEYLDSLQKTGGGPQVPATSLRG